MMRIVNTISVLSLFLFVICGMAGSAGAQQCFLSVCKSAPGAPSDLGFTVNFAGEEIKPFSVELFDGGECAFVGYVSVSTVFVTEDQTQGWPLLDVVCETNEGFSYDAIPGGVSVTCDTSSEASTTCTFVNGQPISNIPTLSEWGMIAAAAGLGLIGAFFAMRRRKLQAA